MHILFLTDNFPPEVNAPASRTFEHSRAWVEAGHSVTVITCAPNFPKGVVFPGYQNKLFQRELVDGINVIRVWSYITPNEGVFKRSLDYVSYMISAIIGSFFVRRADVIVATSPQFFTACAGWIVSLVHWRPWVFELRDLWPESIRAVGALKSGSVLAVLEALELFLYRRARRIISVTHSFRDALAARGIDPAKIFVVTNGVDLARFQPMPKDAALVELLQLSGKFVAGYVGTHGMAHGLETLLDSAAQFQNDQNGRDVHFLLLGDGASKPVLMARAQELRLKNVTFLDTVPKSEVMRYWSLLDVAIIHLKKDPLFTTVIPSKLFECMAMGLAVLHGVEGESARIVEAERSGLVFEPGNATSLTAALNRLRGDPALRQSFAQAGVTAARNYDRSHLAARMLALLSEIAATVQSPSQSHQDGVHENSQRGRNAAQFHEGRPPHPGD